jgi:hypothetical protein
MLNHRLKRGRAEQQPTNVVGEVESVGQIGPSGVTARVAALEVTSVGLLSKKGQYVVVTRVPSAVQFVAHEHLCAVMSCGAPIPSSSHPQ